MNDPVADFLTRLRNATRAGKPECVVPHSRLKAGLADILLKEGFVAGVSEGKDERGHKTLVIKLKYVDGVSAISGLTRVSKPGRRLYASYNEIPRVLNGLGIAIVSTSKGLMKDRDARRNRVGGEILCNVW
ncbi:MAG: 30S ribosomal protein S8 [Verrucomicrobia bacterium]|nr:MAG: 30S ribosomal protein S8 [Verrucomicrobiota bacterium]